MSEPPNSEPPQGDPTDPPVPAEPPIPYPFITNEMPDSPTLFADSPGNPNPDSEPETESEHPDTPEPMLEHPEMSEPVQDHPGQAEAVSDLDATQPLPQQNSETYTQPQEVHSATTVYHDPEEDAKDDIDSEPPSKMAKLSTSCDDDGETCPICLDSWSNSGDHRLVALKCGHLFGNRCVERWLRAQLVKDRSCPTCKSKAAIKDLRCIYARKLVTADTSELTAMQKQLDIVSSERNRTDLELQNLKVAHRACVKELDSLRNVLRLHGARRKWRFSLEKNMEMRDGGCRVLTYNCRTYDMVVSQKSTNSLFPGFGIRRVSCVDQRLGQFTHLHPKPIRDICYSQPRDLLMTVSLDGLAKFVNRDSTAIIVNVGKPLWSCSFDPVQTERFYIGSTNGHAFQYDIRNPNCPLARATVTSDLSPVVSMFGTDYGPVSCQLNSAWLWNTRRNWYATSLPVEPGSFTSLRYDRESQRLLLNCRPNGAERAKMIVMKMSRDGEEVNCYTESLFYGSSKSSVMSRGCWMRGPQALWVAGHSESDGAMLLYGLDETVDQKLSASEPVLDLCPMQISDDVMLGAVSDGRLRVYKGVGVKS